MLNQRSGSLCNRTLHCFNREFRELGRFVWVTKAREILQRSGASSGIKTLGIAGHASRQIRCNKYLVERPRLEPGACSPSILCVR